MIDTEVAARDALVRRLSVRLTFYEDEEVASWLEEHAKLWGRSKGAEIRAAIRYWRSAHEEDD